MRSSCCLQLLLGLLMCCCCYLRLSVSLPTTGTASSDSSSSSDSSLLFSNIINIFLQQSNDSSTPSYSPTEKPSPAPSLFPTFPPTPVPTALPTVAPTVYPTSTPSSYPSLQPTTQPTNVPSGQPSKKPSSIPTTTPSSQPSDKPSTIPSSIPTAIPTNPTSQPTLQPSSVPSSLPTTAPSLVPTSQPTSSPSQFPSSQPTSKPSHIPSSQPTSSPTNVPSSYPSSQPSHQPFSLPSSQPSMQPSGFPSSQPSSCPTGIPSVKPTTFPSKGPSAQPTLQPSSSPSTNPTAAPSSQPSECPTMRPSNQPTGQPSSRPSTCPSSLPSSQPSAMPSSQPSVCPTTQPSTKPTSVPSTQNPTSSPSTHPSSQPSTQPSQQPSSKPSTQPTTFPTTQPTMQPSQSPSRQPIAAPTTKPSQQPSSKPSSQPTTHPTHYELCPGGSFRTLNATHDQCFHCRPGTYSNTGDNVCTRCLPGYYAPTSNMTACLPCPLNTYQGDSAATRCNQCGTGYITGTTASTGKAQCVNPTSSFIIGFIFVGVAIVAMNSYVFRGRLQRIAFRRRERLVKKAILIATMTSRTADLVSTVDNLIRSVRKQCIHLHATAYSTTTRKLLKLCCLTPQKIEYMKTIGFVIIAVFLVLIIIISTIFFGFTQLLFNMMVVYRSYRDYFDLSRTFQEQLSYVANSVASILQIPMIELIASPFIYIAGIFADFTINFGAVQVSCAGSQAPGLLLVDLLVIGIVIIIIRSDAQVYWEVAQNKALIKAMDMTFNPNYVNRHVGLTIAHIIASLCILILPSPTKIIQYSLGFVSVGIFFMSNGRSDSNKNCDNAFSMPYDSILAIITTLFVYIILPPVIYMLSQVIVPSFKLQRSSDKLFPIISLFVECFRSIGCPDPMKTVTHSTSDVSTSVGKNRNNIDDQDDVIDDVERFAGSIQLQSRRTIKAIEVTNVESPTTPQGHEEVVVVGKSMKRVSRVEQIAADLDNQELLQDDPDEIAWDKQEKSKEEAILQEQELLKQKHQEFANQGATEDQHRVKGPLQYLSSTLKKMFKLASSLIAPDWMYLKFICYIVSTMFYSYRAFLMEDHLKRIAIEQAAASKRYLLKQQSPQDSEESDHNEDTKKLHGKDKSKVKGKPKLKSKEKEKDKDKILSKEEFLLKYSEDNAKLQSLRLEIRAVQLPHIPWFLVVSDELLLSSSKEISVEQLIKERLAEKVLWGIERLQFPNYTVAALNVRREMIDMIREYFSSSSSASTSSPSLSQGSALHTAGESPEVLRIRNEMANNQNKNGANERMSTIMEESDRESARSSHHSQVTSRYNPSESHSESRSEIQSQTQHSFSYARSISTATVTIAKSSLMEIMILCTYPASYIFFLHWTTAIGRAIWRRVIQNYISVITLSFGCWMEFAVEDFNIEQDYKNLLHWMKTMDRIMEEEGQRLSVSVTLSMIEKGSLYDKKFEAYELELENGDKDSRDGRNEKDGQTVDDAIEEDTQRDSGMNSITSGGTRSHFQQKGEALMKVVNDPALQFQRFVGAVVSVRVVLLQLVPVLTVISIVAVEIANCPIFVFSKSMNDQLPPFLLKHPFQAARELFQSDLKEINENYADSSNEMDGINKKKNKTLVVSEWKVYCLGFYMFYRQSRIIQFIFLPLNTITTFTLLFSQEKGNNHSNDLFIYALLILMLMEFFLVGLAYGCYFVLLLHRWLFPNKLGSSTKKKEQESMDPVENDYDSRGKGKEKVADDGDDKKELLKVTTIESKVVIDASRPSNFNLGQVCHETTSMAISDENVSHDKFVTNPLYPDGTRNL